MAIARILPVNSLYNNSIIIRVTRGSFLQSFRFGDDLLEVMAVFAVWHPAREVLQLGQFKKAGAKRGFLRAADFYAGAFFNRLHVSRSVMQAAAGAGVQPRKTPAEPVDMELPALQIGDIHVGDFQLAARRGF